MTYRQALRASVSTAAALLLSACGLFSSGPDFEFTRKAEEVSTAAPLERGKTRFAAGQYGLALEAFKDALAEDPKSVRTLNAIGATFDRLGRFDLAEKYYKRALEIEPQSIDTLNNLGYSHYLRGESEAARKYLSLAASLDGNQPVVRANLALAEQSPPPVTGGAETPSGSGVIRASFTAAHGAAGSVAQAPRITVETPRVQLVRIAPGVQQLVTQGAAAVPAPTAYAFIMPAPDSTMGMEAPPPAVPVQPVVLADDQPSFIEVANGTGRTAMAGRIREYLAGRGVTIASLTNDASYDHVSSVLTYRRDAEAVAAEVAELLPVPIRMEPRDDQSADVRLVLGTDLLPFDDKLTENAGGTP